MERLTYFKDGYWRVNFSGVQYQADFVDRLAAYEDTGLTPKEVTALGELFDYALKESKTLTEQLALLEHIRELAEADKDGRVIILPCKVYETDGVRVYEHTVREVIYETAGGPAFDKNAIGKSIFLTRAGAEKALQQMEGENGIENSKSYPEKDELDGTLRQ